MKRKLHWKLILMLLPVSLAGAFFSSCDPEDAKTVPVVTTGEVTDITTTTALGRGEIIADGNSAITANGVVYSNVVDEPTLSDGDKTELTVTSGAFESPLENLASGTTYYIRAYATNSVGTGYGEVMQFTTGNGPPIATDVSITGTVEVNKELTATYTYSDPENDPQEGSTFQWYIANDGVGAGESAISGATTLTYMVPETAKGKYIRFGVTPKASSGSTLGMEVKSAFAGPIGEATTVTFTYNKQTVTYGIITSPVTGRRWMDRNLGAPRVATAYDDWAAYGDSFQWGRGDDGHQVITPTGPDQATGAPFIGTPADPAYSSTDSPGHGSYIIVDTFSSSKNPWDWRKPQNDNLWQGANSVNNPCPSGWHVPTKAEWEAEGLKKMAAAYMQLKLTYTNLRDGRDGDLVYQLIRGVYWSSTVTPLNSSSTIPKGAFYVILSPEADLSMDVEMHVLAMGCRCIKD